MTFMPFEFECHCCVAVNAGLKYLKGESSGRKPYLRGEMWGANRPQTALKHIC